MSGRWFAAAALVSSLALPVAAQVPPAAQSASRPADTRADIRFVGQSHATPQLKRDILVAVAGYAKARHSCGTLTTVETVPLVPGYEPKTPLYRSTAPQHFYERWRVDLCGTNRAFLVAMWPAAQGGADYKVVEVAPGTEP